MLNDPVLHSQVQSDNCQKAATHRTAVQASESSLACSLTHTLSVYLKAGHVHSGWYQLLSVQP